jgi:hypothetical protein
MQPRIIKTWEEYVAVLPIWARGILQNMQVEEHVPIWLFPKNASALIFVVSDGSVVAERGTYAWVIASSQKILISGRGSAFGTTMSSYRAEQFCILSWSIYLWHYTQFLDLQITGILYPFCDNTTTVKSMNDSNDQPKSSMNSDYDIFVETQHLIASLRKTHRIDTFTHVKGHQDKVKPFQELSWLSGSASPNPQWRKTRYT